MVDNRTPESRSALMSRIGPKNTAPEMKVRRLLHKLGYRFRLHTKDLPGKPDIVFPARRRVVFVHGCYWHAHGCAKGRPPRSNQDYWAAKLARNKARDAEKRFELQTLGWRVLEVWQCETKVVETLAEKLVTFLGPATKNSIDIGRYRS